MYVVNFFNAKLIIFFLNDIEGNLNSFWKDLNVYSIKIETCFTLVNV